ncbi:Piso0_005871 [Millerozyma farinosa CBS 7064]|uniref:DNA replication regulator SLD2 n=1 Tax=Pichia sorbitophila (strain ATCC MYA-4447 / BCRC 22081 / CBS 7064 / NBRC 10061 / NRRL Y-12695) TaxID=559304 RepID=G8Y353_PICSO|nr:Piso0_005871 [Millerozyma farinosa CBS 7064]
MSLEKDLVYVKQCIKNWEYSFRKEHTRFPTKNDIKNAPDIHKLYKEYKRLKNAPDHSEIDKANKPNGVLKSIDVEIDSSESEQEEKFREEPFEDAKNDPQLGPTPQANGRVLSIFDLQLTPPDTTPTKKITDKTRIHSASTTPKSEPFKTPTKKPSKISGRSLNSTLHAVSQSHDQSVNIAPIRKDDITDTPQYLARNNHKFLFSIETPAKSQSPRKQHLNSFSVKHEHQSQALTYQDPLTPTKVSKVNFSVSPSPLKPHRIFNVGNKKLSDLFNEIKSANDVADIPGEEFEANNSSDDVDNEEVVNYRKKFTQKRTTRRWKMKPNLAVEQPQEQNINVQQEMEKLNHKEKEDFQNYLDGKEEVLDGYESTEAESKKPQNINEKKIKPISMNYKRLKINNPQKKFFKRRLRR